MSLHSYPGKIGNCYSRLNSVHMVYLKRYLSIFVQFEYNDFYVKQIINNDYELRNPAESLGSTGSLRRIDPNQGI